MNEQKRGRARLVGPVVLIGLGVIFLLNSLGVLAWSVWEVIFRLWPVLLIAAGLEIILSRLSVWGSLLALVLTGAILAGMLWMLGPDIRIGQVVAGEEVRQALGEAAGPRSSSNPVLGRCTSRHSLNRPKRGKSFSRLRPWSKAWSAWAGDRE